MGFLAEISELAAPHNAYKVCNECDHAVLQATDLWYIACARRGVHWSFRERVCGAALSRDVEGLRIGAHGRENESCEIRMVCNVVLILLSFLNYSVIGSYLIILVEGILPYEYTPISLKLGSL